MLTLIAVASAVATIAYFMYDTPLEENTMTVGNASIELVEYQRGANGTVEQFVNDKILIPSTIADGFEYDAVNYDPKKITADTPCVDWNSIKAGYKSPIWDSSNINDEVDKMVFVRNKGNTDVYVRVCFAFEAGNYVWKSHFDRMVHLNKNETDWAWDWYNNGKVVEMNGTRYYIAWATYKDVLPAGEYTEISLSQIALDVSAINDHARAFGDTYDVKVFAQGIQAHGFTDATAALTTGFDDTIPFKNVKEVNFTDLTTALHYLDADTSKTKFVGAEKDSNYRVNSVTFGLTADHAEKVKDYKGIFIANNAGEADFTAYVYYIPNGDKYDIYVLADDWKIYAPKSCSQLFIGMAALTEVDTSNLYVSQTTSMYRMFYNCYSLKTIDVSSWDMTNVTGIAEMFFNCQSLTTLEVDNWFTTKTNNKVGVNQAFFGCSSLKSLDVSNWKIKTGTTLREVFKGCTSLSGKLDLTGWDVSDATTMQEAFCDCSKLTEIDVSTWDVGSVTTFTLMFDDCYALKELDIADWDVSSATSFHGMFRYCTSLKEIELSEWNVEKLSSALGMFLGCNSLTSLDLSGWNTVKLSKTKEMFSKCGNLKTIYVGKDIWNMGSVIESTNMFEQCEALVGGAGTTYDGSKIDKTYAHIDGGTTNPGYLSEKK